MTNEECGIIYIPSMRFLLLTIVFVAFAFAENPIKADSAIVSNTQKDSTLAKNAPKDTIVDTIYVVPDDGIPWNREHFDPERLVRHETFALMFSTCTCCSSW